MIATRGRGPGKNNSRWPISFHPRYIEHMRTINVKYTTKIEQRKLGDKVYVLETIKNLDDAIDQICALLTPEDLQDPFAEDLCPYFGVLWPAAEGLATYLNEHPALVKKKAVLELGSGLGYPSLVASHLGGKVLATDFHPDVEFYFLRNCRHSNVECAYQRLNWREDGADIGKFDVVMGSDVLYESKHPREVAKGLIRFLKPGGVILLSDPGRSYLQQFVHAMSEEGFANELSPVSIGETEVFVFKFTKN